MARIGFSQHPLAPWARPGHWNDPDMLEIGNGAMSETEYRTHMTLWSILAAPLLAGNDLRSMPPGITEILTNREVIAIDQDAEGKQGARASASGEQEIWTRSLAGGSHAVAIFNRGATAAAVTARWSELGVAGRVTRVRDLWAHADLDGATTEYTVSVPAHGSVLVRLTH